MGNSMDEIRVRYGATEENALEDDILINPRENLKECSLVEFLRIPQKKLSAFDFKVQQALAKLYELNGKKAPLYKKFDRAQNEQPLLIDCTTADSMGRDLGDTELAAYISSNRSIEFSAFDSRMSDATFVSTLAHELKHAEQDDKGLKEAFKKANNYQWQQLHFIMEAQAYLFETKVRHKLFPESDGQLLQIYKEVLPKGEATADFVLFCALLKRLPYNDAYKVRYDEQKPINPKTHGLWVDLPKSLQSEVTNEHDFMLAMNRWFIPKGPTTPASQLVYLWKDKKYNEAIQLIESNPTLLEDVAKDKLTEFIKKNNPVMVAKLLDVYERSSCPSKNIIAITSWFRFSRKMRSRKKTSDQMRYVPLLRVLLRYGKKQRMISDENLQEFIDKQKKLKNTVFVQAAMDMMKTEERVESSENSKPIKGRKTHKKIGRANGHNK